MTNIIQTLLHIFNIMHVFNKKYSATVKDSHTEGKTLIDQLCILNRLGLLGDK